MIPAILFYLDDMDLLDQQDENGNEVLTDSEYRKLMRSLKHYARTGEGPKGLSPAGMVAYTFIKQKIDREISKYNTKVENGRKGGKANGSGSKRTEAKGSERKRIEANRSEPKRTEENENENEYVYENENVNVFFKEDGQKEKRRCKPPTLEEVKEYVQTAGLETDAEAFFDYFSSCGWMRGVNPMTDWRAACRSWKNRGIVSISAGKKKVLPAQDFKQRDYTEEEMERNSNSVLNTLIKEKEAAN